MSEQRKSKTSAAVKNRYNKKHYKVFRASLKHELFERVENYKKLHSLSNPQFIQKAIDVLEEKKK